MALKFYNSVTRGLKLKVAKFWGLISMSVEVKRKNPLGTFSTLPPHRVHIILKSYAKAFESLQP